jgi:predicted ATPase
VEPPEITRKKDRLRSSQSGTRNLEPGTLLVGRDAELAQLHTWWAKALSGTRQIVFLSGEPGIGKTALVDAFVEDLRERSQVYIAYGQCVEQYGAGEAYLPLLEATTQLCQGASRERRVAALKRYAPSWLAQLPSLLEPQEFDRLQHRVQGISRERMLREMAETAERFAATRAVVLVLEDLHWSDVSTLDWLTYIARRREPAKLLILGTYRPADVLASNHPLRAVVQDLQARQQCEEMRLTPLGEGAITAYLAKRFGELPEPSALAGTLARRTGGNPLFLVNTVDYLVEQEIVTEEAGRWTIHADKVMEVSEGIPDTLRRLIERQVERLSEEDKRALEVASVVGVEFAVAEAAAGLPGDVEALEFQYERFAHTGQFLRTEGVAEWPDGTLSGRYRFLHAVYQEVVSARVGEVRRMQLHRRIAERKEAAYGERAREVAAELAVHFEQGREYAKAVPYRRQAGEAAARSGAPREALSHLKRGLELLTLLPDNPERIQQEVRLQLALANPLYAIGDRTTLEEMEHAYLRAYELCQRLGEPLQLASVLFGLCMVYELRGEVQKGLNLAQQLLTLAQKVRNPALLLRAHMALGYALYFRGEFLASHHHFEQGLKVYDPDKHNPRVSNVAQDLGVICFSCAGWDLWCLGYPDQARRSIDSGLTLAHELSHFLSEAFALSGAIGVMQECGELPIVERHVTRLIALSQEQGLLYSRAWGKIVQGWLLVGQGQAEEGIAQLYQGLAHVRLGGQDL